MSPEFNFLGGTIKLHGSLFLPVGNKLNLLLIITKSN